TPSPHSADRLPKAARAPPAAERRGTEVAWVMTRQPRPRSLPSRVITPGDAPPAAQPTSRRPLHDERYGPWRARDQGPEGPRAPEPESLSRRACDPSTCRGRSYQLIQEF